MPSLQVWYFEGKWAGMKERRASLKCGIQLSTLLCTEETKSWRATLNLNILSFIFRLTALLGLTWFLLPPLWVLPHTLHENGDDFHTWNVCQLYLLHYLIEWKISSYCIFVFCINVISPIIHTVYLPISTLVRRIALHECILCTVFSCHGWLSIALRKRSKLLFRWLVMYCWSVTVED